uniref:Uncharacterized protein n=1 Tax=Tetradesmus obliquus TaxID=3088 RepID=A0A383WCP8_TETOB
MADERHALKELVKSHIPGTAAHHRRSDGDPAFCAATATGKNADLATEQAQPDTLGGSAQPTAGLQQQQPGAAGEILKGLGAAAKP